MESCSERIQRQRELDERNEPQNKRSRGSEWNHASIDGVKRFEKGIGQKRNLDDGPEREKERSRGGSSKREADYVLAWRVLADQREKTAERELAAVPTIAERRERRRRGLLKPPPSNTLLSITTGMSGRILSIDVLPCGASVIFLIRSDKLLAWAGAEWSLLWEINPHDGKIYKGAFAVLGNGVVVTGGWDDELVRTWNIETGELLGELHVNGRGVTALAAIDGRRFVAASRNRGIIFCEHSVGTRLSEVLHDASDLTQPHCIREFSVHKRLIASTMCQGQAMVWDTRTRTVATIIGGYDDPINRVDMTDNRVAIGFTRAPFVCVYNSSDYSCISNTGAIEWVHNKQVNSVHMLDDIHVMTASEDRTIAISSMETNRIVARVRLSFVPLRTAVLPDGSIVVRGYRTRPTYRVRWVIISAPPATASLLRAYGGSKQRERSRC